MSRGANRKLPLENEPSRDCQSPRLVRWVSHVSVLGQAAISVQISHTANVVQGGVLCLGEVRVGDDKPPQVVPAIALIRCGRPNPLVVPAIRKYVGVKLVVLIASTQVHDSSGLFQSGQTPAISDPSPIQLLSTQVDRLLMIERDGLAPGTAAQIHTMEAEIFESDH